MIHSKICKARNSGGFSLLEVTLVLGFVISISVAGFAGVGYFSRINDAKKAQSVLIQVEAARTSWLLDNPQRCYQDVTLANIEDIMPDMKATDLLRDLGYSIGDKDIQQENISYGRDEGRLPVPGFALRN